MNERKTPEPDTSVSDFKTAAVKKDWEQRKKRQPSLAKLESRIQPGQTVVAQGDVVHDPVAFFVIQGSLLEIIRVEHAGQEFREVINEIGPGGLAFCQGVTGSANKPSLLSVIATNSGATVARFRREHIELDVSMNLIESLFEGIRRTLTLLAQATVDRFDEAIQLNRNLASAMEAADEAYREMSEAEDRVEREKRKTQEALRQAAKERTALIKAREGFEAELKRFALNGVGFEIMAALTAHLLMERGVTEEELRALLVDLIGEKPSAILDPVQEAIQMRLSPVATQEQGPSANQQLVERHTAEWPSASSTEEAGTNLPGTIHIDVEYEDPDRIEKAHDTEVGLAPPDPPSDLETRDTVPVPSMDEEERSMETDRPAWIPEEPTAPPLNELASEAPPRRDTEAGGFRRQTNIGVAPPSVGTPRPSEFDE